MKNNLLCGKTAIVTGASSGLGVDFARELASRGCHLILLARREDLLRAVQQEIHQKYGVNVDIFRMDLNAEGAAESLYQQTAGSGRVIDVLVNNAGFGIYGPYVEIPWEKEQAMLMLDMVVLAHLTRLFLPGMLERNFGYVLQVASIAGFQPSPRYTSYAAAKSFVLNFGEALNYELRKTKVGVTVVAPGVTASEFLKVAGQKPNLYQRLIMMKSPDVARIGVDAMLRRRPSVITGLLNALMVWSNRLAPRRVSAAVANWLMLTE